MAGVRFGLSFVSEQLVNDHADGRLLQATQDVCMEPRVNMFDGTGRNDTTGPAQYLIKLLVRHFGFSNFKAMSKNHLWIIPEEFRSENEVSFGTSINY